MERVIKFRGISLDTNKWVYGYAAFDSTFEYAVIINKQATNEMQKWAVDPKTVGQFTGLTDKNGKEIYEGDILKVKSASSTPISIEHNGEQLTAYKPNYSNYYVVFYKGAFCIHNEPSTDNHEKTSIYNGTTYGGTLQSANYDKEVIDNVHEHPHLIK